MRQFDDDEWVRISSMSLETAHSLTYMCKQYPDVFYFVETSRSRITGKFAHEDKYFGVRGCNEAFMCLASALKWQQDQRDAIVLEETEKVTPNLLRLDSSPFSISL